MKQLINTTTTLFAMTCTTAMLVGHPPAEGPGHMHGGPVHLPESSGFVVVEGWGADAGRLGNTHGTIALDDQGRVY